MPGSLALTLDGKTVPLNGVTLATTDQVTWTVAGLAPLTGASGHYALTLTAAGSGIRDAAGNLISTDSGTSWVMDTVPPTASISAVQPNPGNSAVGSVTISFSEPVSGSGAGQPRLDPQRQARALGRRDTGHDGPGNLDRLRPRPLHRGERPLRLHAHRGRLRNS